MATDDPIVQAIADAIQPVLEVHAWGYNVPEVREDLAEVLVFYARKRYVIMGEAHHV